METLLLTKMYSEMNKQFETVYTTVKEQFAAVNGRIDTLQSEVKTIGNQLTMLENDL